jgi:hypothetical protein
MFYLFSSDERENFKKRDLSLFNNATDVHKKAVQLERAYAGHLVIVVG